MNASPDVQFRPLRPEDVEAVRVLHCAAWMELAGSSHTPEQMAAHSDLIASPDYGAALLANRMILAWAENDELLGSAGWCDVPDDPKGARIRKVFVRPECAGTGLGRRLVEAVEAEARAAGRTWFFVRANANAEGFYRRLGYSPASSGTMEASGVALPVVFMEKRSGS